jgi:hypothetical protein
VRSEIAKFAANDRLETAHADVSRPNKVAQLTQPARLKSAEERPKSAEERPTHPQRDLPAKDHLQIAQAEMPKLQKRVESEQVADGRQKQQQRQLTTFLDSLSSSVNSGDVFVQRRLTTADLKDYAERTYHGSGTAKLMTIASE